MLFMLDETAGIKIDSYESIRSAEIGSYFNRALLLWSVIFSLKPTDMYPTLPLIWIREKRSSVEAFFCFDCHHNL
jgi:hypothetical protein